MRVKILIQKNNGSKKVYLFVITHRAIEEPQGTERGPEKDLSSIHKNCISESEHCVCLTFVFFYFFWWVTHHVISHAFNLYNTFHTLFEWRTDIIIILESISVAYKLQESITSTIFFHKRTKIKSSNKNSSKIIYLS